MRIAFFHDHHFHEDGARVLSESQFDHTAWDRYLAVFDELVVVARQAPPPGPERAKRFQVSSRDRVSFRLGAGASSLKSLLTGGGPAFETALDAVAGVDAVVARLPSELGLLGLRAAHRLGKPCLVEVVACIWDGLVNHGTLKARLYAPLATRRMRAAVAAAPFVQYVTRDFLQARYPNRTGHCVAISNVRIPAPDPAVLARRLDAIATRPDGPVTLGLIGSLVTRHKGLHVAIPALAGLVQAGHAARLEVVGNGPQAGWQQMAEAHGVAEHVRFRGTLPPGQPIFDWLDGIDLYIQPSLQEGLPRALIEAMSRGCPAIASRCAGIPELLAPGDLVARGSVAGLGGALADRLGDRDWMATAARRNWETAQGYAADRLDRQMTAFWATFRDHVAASARTRPAA